MFPDTLMVGMEIRLKVGIKGFLRDFFYSELAQCILELKLLLGAFMLYQLAYQTCL